MGGTIASGGANLGSDTSCSLSVPGDLSATDPMLGPPAANGGPTETRLPLSGSPAIDLVAGSCPPPGADQRGVARPDGAGCDAGAVEADATPPETRIAKHPRTRLKTRKRRAKAKFKFTATEDGSSFECKLDRKPFKPCDSPRKYRAKAGKRGGKPRKHKFRVRATDAAGNTDPTPAKFKFKVRRKG
jgi:hypothetical protein